MANGITRFSFPTTIVFGAGAVGELAKCLKEVGISKPLLVTDAGLKELDVFAKVQDVLSKASVPFGVFAEVHPNPLVEDVEKAVEIYREEKCDGIIGLGGGSPLDAL